MRLRWGRVRCAPDPKCATLMASTQSLIAGAEMAVVAEEAEGALAATLLDLYCRRGWSLRQIASSFRIDRHRATRILKQAGMHIPAYGAGRARPAQRTPISARQAQLIRRLYVSELQGMSQIGERVGVSAHTVRRVLREAGVPIRTRGWANREDRMEPSARVIEDLYLIQGLTAEDVARRVGCSRRIVLRLAHDLGWPVPIGGPPPQHGPQEIELIRALYADPSVRQTLMRHGVRRVDPGSAIWKRFPEPVFLTNCPPPGAL